MADNYLEKKFEEYQEKKLVKHKINKSHIALDSLLLKNRSYRGYDKSYIVKREELIEIVKVNNKIPSARNQQVLRFKLALGEDADFITKNIKLGGALPELHLPFKGTEPNAYIIVCSTVPENKWVDIDLGISSQSMLLKAVEIGLNGICIGAFNKNEIVKQFNLKLEPILIIAIGKGLEKIQILPISQEDNINYFRENGIHYVPKIKIDNLII